MQVKIDFGNLKLGLTEKYGIAKRLKRLERLCRMFNPDLVSVDIRVVKNNPREGFVFYLKLSVPNRHISSVGRSKKFILALGEAFDKVMSQFRKHRARLRKSDSFVKVSKKKGKV